MPQSPSSSLISQVPLPHPDRRSFDNLNEWIDLCLNSKKEKTIAVILGNKCDLEGEREVDAETIKAKVDDCSLPYFEVSAKTGVNVK